MKEFTNTKRALKVIAPIKGMRWQWYVSISISAPVSMIIAMSFDTVLIFSASVDMINNIFIAFIAMEMGAYAIFQALLTDELVLKLYKSGGMLDEANESFLGMILLFWFGIMVNIILIIILKTIPSDALVCNTIWVSNLIASIIMFFYFLFSFRILFEVRNFAINLYRVLMAHNRVAILRGIEKEKKENEVD